jgi:hypothetical protein
MFNGVLVYSSHGWPVHKSEKKFVVGLTFYLNNKTLEQGCGSGSGLDPDSETCVDLDPDWIRIQRLVWIRIRIGKPDPDPGARKLRNFSGKMHFLVI